jgi:Spirocyclase AveC-like
LSSTTEAPTLDPRDARAVPDRRHEIPIIWWAVVGVLFLGLLVYAWSTWLFGGDAHATSTGLDPVPTWQVVTARSWEILFGGWALVAIYFFLIRPWRQGRGLTLDGMLLIAWFTLWALQDPWLSYTQGWFSYNAEFVDLGCPQCHIPGWMDVGVRENLPEPLFFMAGMYVGVFTSSLLLANRIMRWAETRWPRIGTAGLIAIAWGLMALTDLVLEVIWLRNGLYAYPGAHRDLSIFPGSQYQFPLYEAVLWGGLWGAMACLRYFRNDRGETVAERGLDRVRAGRRGRSALRLLAIIGIAQTFMLFYNIGIGFAGLKADTWPDAVLEKSYLTAGMCGEGTDRACSDPRVPISRGEGSGHASPEGRWVDPPEGLPNQVSP